MSWIDKFLQALNLVQSGGASLPQQPTLNFIGATVSNDGPNNRTTVTVSGNLQVANILDFGGNGNGMADNTAAMAAAIIALAPNGVVYFPPGLYRFSTTQEWDANMWFGHGAAITVDSLATVTIVGSIDANAYQDILQGAGSIVLITASDISVCWFGADPTQSTDSHAAFAAAITAAKTTNSTAFGVLTRHVRVPAGKYLIYKPISNTSGNVRVRGDGSTSTQVWLYGVAAPCFNFSNLSLMTLTAAAYAGGNTANIGDGPVLALHRYGPAWYLDGQAEFSLDCIFQAKTTPQTQSSVLISSRGIDPDFNTGRNAFYLFLLGADNGYSYTNEALQWVLHTSSGTVTAQTAAGCIVPGNTFYNIRLDYDGAYMRIFVNGVAQTLTNADTKIAQTGTIVQHYAEGVSLGIGLSASFWGTTPIYTPPQGCTMASLRLKWVSQGSANYSPPVAKFTEDSDTRFLLNFDVTDAVGGLMYARAWGGTSFGMQDTWLPNEDGSDVTKQISYCAIEKLTLISNNGPAVNLNACPNVLVARNNLYGQGGVYVNQNSYNSAVEKNNIFVSGDRVQNGGKGIGIWCAAASNYVIPRDNNVTGFDICHFSGASFALEGYNYFVQPRYAGIYLENAYAGAVHGNAFISDEGSAFDNPYGLVIAGCGCIDVRGVLFGVAAHTDQYQILINNSSGSPTPKSHITIGAVNLTSGVGQSASVKVTHTRVGDEVILAGCAPGVNNIPLLEIDSTTLGRILVEPWEESQLPITMTDADFTPTADEWHYGKLIFSGTLTADRNVIVPTIGGYTRIIQNQTALALYVKTAAGTGVYVPPGQTGVVSCDGTNVVLDSLGGNTLRSITSGASSTAFDWDEYVAINKSGVYDLTAPPAPVDGQVLIMKDEFGDAATNNKTFTPNAGQTVDGGSSLAIAVNFGKLALVYSAATSNWMS